MKKEFINKMVNLLECEVVSKECFKGRPRPVYRHFSYVDNREIKQTAARDLWDRTVVLSRFKKRYI